MEKHQDWEAKVDTSVIPFRWCMVGVVYSKLNALSLVTRTNGSHIQFGCSRCSKIYGTSEMEVGFVY